MNKRINGEARTRLNAATTLSKEDEQRARAATARIIPIAEPLLVLLFGSRARGDARPTSDYDLLVILPDSSDLAVLWDRMLHAVSGVLPPIDIVPTTQTLFAERSRLPFFVERYAAQEGIILYER